jgi:uncharacterized protein YutD
MTHKIALDFPRPIRISSHDGSIEEIRTSLRKNMITHKKYNPTLDSLKSRLLLEGIYQPNQPTLLDDYFRSANDFIREHKNHRCENFTISDIQETSMKEQARKKVEERERKLQTLVKPLT